MKKILQIEVMTFDELDEKAKQKAREWYYAGAFDFDWREYIYEDAATIGLKLESFDLDRNRHATGAFIDDAITCAKLIIAEHGEACETFKIAQAFLEGMKAPNNYEEANAEDFLKALLEDYAMTLQKEADYMATPEYIDENILANEYTFTASGERQG